MRIQKTAIRSLKRKLAPLAFFSSLVLATFVLTGLLKAVTGSAISALILVLGFLVTLLAMFGSSAGHTNQGFY